ncbi:MAG: hypothetical protein HYY65_14660 [Candidatus Tectomicrobia bacterium]|uniref:Uncharacterized protein n=1 Tax=Tectimicrobiota bacterium TaxID=2528274 RepID=A0A932M1W8_UNCTE|nr:hypothetical protein [Candidatus Tectomicrobia bacterium]
MARIAEIVSCPVCRKTIVLPEGVRAGERISHCGRQFVLTYEFGAFAAEAPK